MLLLFAVWAAPVLYVARFYAGPDGYPIWFELLWLGVLWVFICFLYTNFIFYLSWITFYPPNKLYLFSSDPLVPLFCECYLDLAWSSVGVIGIGGKWRWLFIYDDR